MIVDSILDFTPINVIAKISIFDRSDVSFYLKNEIFNPAGSIKFKPAVGIIRELEACGALGPKQGVIETTSGNMGIALSIVAKARGYSFVCVSDDKITRHNRGLIEAYGTELVIMPESSLAERYLYIEDRIRKTPTLVWTRQFINPTNPNTHEHTTARELLQELPAVTHVFVGTGTAGTIAGFAKAFESFNRKIQLIAVDAVGSLHFTSLQEGQRRLLPGIGASERSPFLNEIQLDEIEIVPEQEAIAACRKLADRTGWLFGASSGSVLAAMNRFQRKFKGGDLAVGIAADSGERYLDSIYNDNWIAANFPEMQTRL
jgi:cysteine synthase A